MFSRRLTRTVWRLRLALAAGLVLVGVVWLGHVSSAGLGSVLLQGCLVALTGAAWVLNLLALRKVGPAEFVVDPRTASFRTPPHPTQLYTAIMITSYVAVAVPPPALFHPADGPGFAGLLLRVMAAGLVVLSGFIVVLAGAMVVAVWLGTGVRLRPDCLIDRTPFGILVVPWEALAAGSPVPVAPTASSLTLVYAKPELVRRHGLVLFRRTVTASNIDTAFLAHAIRYYVYHPQHRPAIGTPAGYEDLLQALLLSSS